MPTHQQKIAYLEDGLNKPESNYADSFKADITIFIDDFSLNNELLDFLEKLTSFEEIDVWIEKLTSRIVLKFDSESEQLNEFIYDYIKLG